MGSPAGALLISTRSLKIFTALTGIQMGAIPLPRFMPFLHHQAMLRDEDGQFVCSRCGLMNPSDDQPCIPLNLEPAELPHGEEAA